MSDSVKIVVASHRDLNTCTCYKKFRYFDYDKS